MTSFRAAASRTSSGVVLSVRYRAIRGLKRCGGEDEEDEEGEEEDAGGGGAGMARSIRER